MSFGSSRRISILYTRRYSLIFPQSPLFFASNLSSRALSSSLVPPVLGNFYCTLKCVFLKWIPTLLVVLLSLSDLPTLFSLWHSQGRSYRTSGNLLPSDTPRLSLIIISYRLISAMDSPPRSCFSANQPSIITCRFHETSSLLLAPFTPCSISISNPISHRLRFFDFTVSSRAFVDVPPRSREKFRRHTFEFPQDSSPNRSLSHSLS